MKSLRRLVPYIKKYKWRFYGGLAAITVSNVFSVAIPHYVGETIDRLGKGTLDGTVLLRMSLIVLALSIGSGLFLFLTRQTLIVLSRLVERDLRNDYVRHIQSLSMSYFTRTPTGDLMALATNDISAVREFVGPALMYTANTITTFLFAMTMMLALSVKITLLALIPLPLVSYSVYYFGKQIHVLFGAVQKQYADLTSHAQENMSGVRVVRSYVRETFASTSFSHLSQLYKVKNMQLAKVQALMMPVMMSLIGLSMIIVMVAGGYEVMQGRSTIGDIIQFNGYIGQLIWPVIAIGWVTNLVQRASASMGRLSKIFDMEADITDAHVNGAPLIEIRGKVEFRNVSFRYRPELPYVLKNISFAIEPGNVLAIIGTTGSGKSTIVQLIGRLYDPSEGQVLIDGRPIQEIPLDLIRESIGVVTQETFLFSDTLAGNIRFGNSEAGEREVEEAAKIAQLYDNVQGFPEKFETVVGERGITLSGGQKQRTSLARAVLRKPKILMLDDALSAVDTDTEEKILRGLENIMKSRTSILIAHRVSTVKDANQIIVMHDGEIIERGTHEKLLELRGSYATTYERQLLEEQLESF